jgi:hypothetical protein
LTRNNRSYIDAAVLVNWNAAMHLIVIMNKYQHGLIGRNNMAEAVLDPGRLSFSILKCYLVAKAE